MKQIGVIDVWRFFGSIRRAGRLPAFCAGHLSVKHMMGSSFSTTGARYSLVDSR